MNGSDITVVIPTIPGRTAMLHRALASVEAQGFPAAAVVIVLDSDNEGAPAIRTRGLEMVRTTWTAFLDDDDELYTNHLRSLMMHQETTGADLVFPWFDVVGGSDPFPDNEHREFDLANPHQTTVTFLVRTEAAVSIGGFIDNDEFDPERDPGMDSNGHRAGEEFRFVIRLAQAGYQIAHLHQRTWLWHHHRSNSMGMASKRLIDRHPEAKMPKALGTATY